MEKQQELQQKPKEDLTTIDELKLAVGEIINQGYVTPIVPHLFEGNNYKIDFDNDTIEGNLEDVDKGYTEDFFESFPISIFTKESSNINGINYYFLKHNRLDKFVVFDENMKFYKTEDLPQEVKDDSNYKYIENCN